MWPSSGQRHTTASVGRCQHPSMTAIFPHYQLPLPLRWHRKSACCCHYSLLPLFSAPTSAASPSICPLTGTGTVTAAKHASPSNTPSSTTKVLSPWSRSKDLMVQMWPMGPMLLTPDTGDSKNTGVRWHTLTYSLSSVLGAEDYTCT